MLKSVSSKLSRRPSFRFISLFSVSALTTTIVASSLFSVSASAASCKENIDFMKKQNQELMAECSAAAHEQMPVPSPVGQFFVYQKQGKLADYCSKIVRGVASRNGQLVLSAEKEKECFSQVVNKLQDPYCLHNHKNGLLHKNISEIKALQMKCGK